MRIGLVLTGLSAVLYIGLGVDYAVHYGLRYRELRGQGRELSDGTEVQDHTEDCGIF